VFGSIKEHRHQQNLLFGRGRVTRTIAHPVAGTYLQTGSRAGGLASLVNYVVTVTLSEIEDEVDQVVGRWRSQTSTEQRNDLSFLDDLLGELDDVDTGSARTTAEMVDNLRGRVEILMDEIEISLGIEPPPITGLTDIDADLAN